MAGREGVQLRSTSPTAGEYAVRLVFLAREARLPAEQIRQKYVRQPKNLGFSPAGARSILQWLLQRMSMADVKQLAKGYPNVWLCELDTLQANKPQLQRFFGLTDAPWAKVVSAEPQLLYSPATAEAMAAWLQREPARLSEGEVREVFRVFSPLFSYSSTTVEGKVRLVMDLCSLGPAGVKHLVTKCTAALCQSEDKLAKLITALVDHGFTGRQVAKILRSAKTLFSFDLEGRVLPLLAELERLLGGDRDGAIAVAAKGGALLNISAGLLRFNFDWLITHGGLSEGQVRGLLQQAPVLFTWDFADATFQTKLAYWQALLGISLPEVLDVCSPYLKEGLAKVDRRVYAMEQRGELHCLLGTLSWAAMSGMTFEKKYGVPPAAKDDEGWRASPRVEQFGLLEAKVQHKGYAKAGPKAWQGGLGRE